MDNYPYIYEWDDSPIRAALKGQRCRIVATSPIVGAVVVKFKGGRGLITSRRALRRVDKETDDEEKAEDHHETDRPDV